MCGYKYRVLMTKKRVNYDQKFCMQKRENTNLPPFSFKMRSAQVSQSYVNKMQSVGVTSYVQRFCPIFCGMQRVVFHSTFPSFLARKFTGVYLISQIFQLLRTITNISDHIRKSFPKIYEHFRRFPENFKRS